MVSDNEQVRWWDLAAAAVAGWALHAATLTNALYTHDGWNDLLLGELVLSGGLDWYENLLRLLVTLSFGLRALFGADMWAWHLPNVLTHGINAALVLVLTVRLGGSLWAARAGAALFATMPLLAHPVEWIGGGYDLFATAGVLGAGVALLDRRPWLAAVISLVALTSKESGMMVAPVGLVLCLAAEGRPQNRAAWFALLKRLAPTLLASLLLLGLRLVQVQSAPNDAMAGRSVELRPLSFLTAAPAAVGIAGAGSLTESINLRDATRAAPFGWTALALFLVGLALRPSVIRQGLGILGASAVALIPVSLIAMDTAEMVENSRYLYLSAALTAPLLPLLLLGPEPRPRKVGAIATAVMITLSLWGGVEAVSRSARQGRAVSPVIERILALPHGSEVIVFTNLYDEATSRFLMSRWLAVRGVRASYVMRGTWIRYSRRGGGGSDAAQAYFGPAPRPLTRETVPDKAILLLQLPAEGSVEQTSLPAKSAMGPWRELPGVWTAISPTDPEDPPIEIIDGRTLVVERFLGPVATAEISAAARIQLQPDARPLRGVRLHLRVQSQARPRYGTGYHDRFGALFWGAPTDTRRMVSFPVDQPQPIVLRLEMDPVAPGAKPTELGILPLNYPAKVTIERVEVAR